MSLIRKKALKECISGHLPTLSREETLNLLSTNHLPIARKIYLEMKAHQELSFQRAKENVCCMRKSQNIGKLNISKNSKW